MILFIANFIIQTLVKIHLNNLLLVLGDIQKVLINLNQKSNFSTYRFQEAFLLHKEHPSENKAYQLSSQLSISSFSLHQKARKRI